MGITLTLGMACYQDYPGVWATVQALRFYHAEAMPECELIVVDNRPESEDGQAVKRLIENWGTAGCAAVRYVPFPSPIGTAAPRQAVFEEAQGEWVFVMDPHIFWAPGSVRKTMTYLKQYPNSRSLYSGYMLYDDLRLPATNFTREWGGAMEGKWFTDTRGLVGTPAYSDAPWEIEAMGLGLFGCRKSVFPGFNERFRGFGGEEWYLHRKIRRNGGRCIALPWIKWPHRFGHPGGSPYPSFNEHKLRNFILGHRELNVPLDRCRRHFCEGWDEQLQAVDPEFPCISPAAFDRIVQDVDLGIDEPYETTHMEETSAHAGAALPPGVTMQSHMVLCSRVSVLPAPHVDAVSQQQTDSSLPG